jgi:hypothetical protein
MACQSDPFGCQRYGCCAPACCPTPSCCSIPCVLPPSPLPALPASAAFQATASANQSLTAATAAQLLFQYPTSANALVYTPYTSVFQAPTSGAYLFTVNVAWTSATAGNLLTLSLNVAGLNVLSTTNYGVITIQNNAVLTGVVTLAAGQTVTVQAISTAASTVLGQVPAPTSLTWFGGSRA